jgi:hypothetical protein
LEETNEPESGGRTKTIRDRLPIDVRGWNWGIIRSLLGFAQMLGATVSLILLFVTGVNTYTLSGVIITGVLTTISVLLFGGRRGDKDNAC